ncbi:hypothetical protein NDU88_007462 [Pleurodeles waltl]|uniref:Uncharacterized protein n=1 Tax=Pleurodeles waltl TaxID=8319 RepID=A0AAV7SSK1_PLEWA|nr:hypothetical protein NDU88_007462 [Pleurodeles waltl]
MSPAPVANTAAPRTASAVTRTVAVIEAKKHKCSGRFTRQFVPETPPPGHTPPCLLALVLTGPGPARLRWRIEGRLAPTGSAPIVREAPPRRPMKSYLPARYFQPGGGKDRGRLRVSTPCGSAAPCAQPPVSLGARREGGCPLDCPSRVCGPDAD